MQIGYSNLILFVYVGTLQMHKCAQYEVTMTDYVHCNPNQRKLPKWQ